MRQIGRLHLVHAIVEGIFYLPGACLCAFSACRAFLIYISGIEFDSHIKIPIFPGDVFHLSHCEKTYSRVLSQPTEVDFQSAQWGAQFGEILMELGHSSTQIGVLFHNVGVIPGFGRFEGGRYPSYAATNHQDSLGLCTCHACPPRLI